MKFLGYWWENIKETRERFELCMWVVLFFVWVAVFYLNHIHIENEFFKEAVEKYHVELVVAIIYGIICITWLPYKRHRKEQVEAAFELAKVKAELLEAQAKIADEKRKINWEHDRGLFEKLNDKCNEGKTRDLIALVIHGATLIRQNKQLFKDIELAGKVRENKYLTPQVQEKYSNFIDSIGDIREVLEKYYFNTVAQSSIYGMEHARYELLPKVKDASFNTHEEQNYLAAKKIAEDAANKALRCYDEYRDEVKNTLGK